MWSGQRKLKKGDEGAPHTFEKRKEKGVRQCIVVSSSSTQSTHVWTENGEGRREKGQGTPPPHYVTVSAVGRRLNFDLFFIFYFCIFSYFTTYPYRNGLVLSLES